MSSRWTEYYDAVEKKPLNPFLNVLEPHLPKSGRAIDLGCGSGRATAWLLQHGLAVQAVDNDQEGLRRLQERFGDQQGLTVTPGSFEDVRLGRADLVLSLFSLFFAKPEKFEEIWQKITDALAPRGLFAGQLLGPGDDWANECICVHSRQDVKMLLCGWDVLHWEEAQRDGETATGKAKHWHIHHIIARLK